MTFRLGGLGVYVYIGGLLEVRGGGLKVYKGTKRGYRNTWALEGV